jgi:hypothetical protein
MSEPLAKASFIICGKETIAPTEASAHSISA